MYAELTTALFAIFLMATSVAIAQTQQQIRKHGYTLTIENTDPTFDITEGIADFVRFEYGVANTSGGWALPPYAPDHHYTDSYRITACFFVWIEKRVKRGVIKVLDSAARSKTYNHTFWTTQTGRSIDELWDAYTLQPAI